jgi:SAM-dependent methyltransferase
MSVPAYHFANLHSHEFTHWWYRGRLLWARGLIDDWHRERAGEPVEYLDVGAGTGAFARSIPQSVPCTRVGAADKDPVALAYLQGSGRTEVFALDLEGDFELPWPPSLITCMDVLEHIQDDRAFLRRLHGSLRPGGLLLVSVPALPWLYSQWDRNLGHHRRYTRRSLVTRLRQAGFRVRECHYGWSFLAPAFPLRKLSLRRRSLLPSAPRIVNEGLVGMSRPEFRLRRLIPVPFGSSLFAAAEKP